MALLDTLAAEGKSIDEKIDGYTEAQRYFLGFAQVWCQNQTEQAARQLALTDPHSPGRWRVNGTVQNFDEFGKAFGCKKGQPMYPGQILPRLVDRRLTCPGAVRRLRPASVRKHFHRSSAIGANSRFSRFEAFAVDLCRRCGVQRTSAPEQNVESVAG